MKKQIFKKDDKVFDIKFGWGVVKEIDNSLLFSVLIEFGDNKMGYTSEGKISLTSIEPTLSFTEYRIDKGFSQERVINYKDYLGKWGKFWNNHNKDYIISKLDRVESNGFKSNTSTVIYDNFQPLTEEQIKILELENN